MKFHFTTFFIFSLFLVSACEEELFTPINESIKETPQVNIAPKNEMFLCISEPQPEFPSGVVSLLKFIAANLQLPQALKDACIEGKVIVQFIVKEDGTIDMNKIKIFRGIHPLLDAEAIRVVKLFPKWIPATKKGKPIPYWFTLPVAFKLK